MASKVTRNRYRRHRALHLLQVRAEDRARKERKGEAIKVATPGEVMALAAKR